MPGTIRPGSTAPSSFASALMKSSSKIPEEVTKFTRSASVTVRPIVVSTWPTSKSSKYQSVSDNVLDLDLGPLSNLSPDLDAVELAKLGAGHVGNNDKSFRQILL